MMIFTKCVVKGGSWYTTDIRNIHYSSDERVYRFSSPNLRGFRVVKLIKNESSI